MSSPSLAQGLRRHLGAPLRRGARALEQARQEHRRRQADRRAEANRRLLGEEFRAHALELASHPTRLILEPATACNLRCPFCPTGGGYLGLKREILQPETFARVVAHVDLELIDEVVLYNWGEPFVNKHLLDYVRFFSQRRIWTMISTNFSAADYDREFLASLVRSGLSKITVSIDGATQEVYERYRVRGDLARVLGNLQRLDEVKRDLGVGYPAVTYRMLLTKHNQHQVEQARQQAIERGAEFDLNRHFWTPPEARDDWQADDLRSQGATALVFHEQHAPEDEEIDTYCRHLWDSIVVNADGSVFPCCLIYKQEHAVGSLLDRHLRELRNDPRLVALRRYAVDLTAPAPAFANHCESCSNRYCVTRQQRVEARLAQA